MSLVGLRVSDAGQRHRRDIHQWPASESRQGKNPRGMGRGECRALRYGDLADAEGVSAGAPCPLRRFVTWQAGSDRSGFVGMVEAEGNEHAGLDISAPLMPVMLICVWCGANSARLRCVPAGKNFP